MFQNTKYDKLQISIIIVLRLKNICIFIFRKILNYYLWLFIVGFNHSNVFQVLVTLVS